MTIHEITDSLVKLCYETEMPTKKKSNLKSELLRNLSRSSTYTIDYTVNLIYLHQKISMIETRLAYFVEEGVMERIIDLASFPTVMIDDLPSDGFIDLPRICSEDAPVSLKIASEMLKYAESIILANNDKKKRQKNRVRDAIAIVDELNYHFNITDIKDLFNARITDTDKGVQEAAMIALENYYGFLNGEEIIEKLTPKEEKILRKIINSSNSSKERNIVFPAIKILLYTGVIDDDQEMLMIDRWRARTYN